MVPVLIGNRYSLTPQIIFMKKLLLSSLVFALVLTGCSKDDDDATCDLNNTNLVGTYKTTAVKYKATPTSPEEDEFSTWDACEKDDLIIFNNNGTATIQDAGVKCVPPGDDTVTWSLNGNIITIDNFISSTITNFSCTGMQVTITEPSGGVTVTTLVRQ